MSMADDIDFDPDGQFAADAYPPEGETASTVSDAPAGEVFPAPSNPMGVARELVKEYRDAGRTTLRRWRGGWMLWQGTHWAETEDTVIRSRLYQRLEHAEFWHTDPKTGEPELKPWHPNRRKMADLVDALPAVGLFLPETVDPPAWLGGDRSTYRGRAGQVVACTNGLLDVSTRELHDLTPDFFNLVSVPFDCDPKAPEPATWLRFLAELWPGGPDQTEPAPEIAVLQEFFGYVLSGRTDLQKILMLIGPTRSGKGTIARVLAALVGKGNVAGPTLDSLGTNFGLAPLLGKPVAVVSDARLGRANVNQVVERLLSISGEDTLTVDRKYRDPWTGKLSARFLLLSNELPNFGDASGAIANRFVVLTMDRSWLGRENAKLTDELVPELPGILNWSLDGLDRLVAKGRFTDLPSSASAVTAMQDLGAPVSAFVRDHCHRAKPGEHCEVLVTDLVAAWKQWCEDNGQKPGTNAMFGRNLRAVIPGLTVSQPRGEDGKQVRVYVGLALSTPHSGVNRVSSRVSVSESDIPDGTSGLTRDSTRLNPPSPQHQTTQANTGTPAPSGPGEHCDQCGRMAPVTEWGPCPICRARIHKYGEAGHGPLCATCKAKGTAA